ncbi:MAG: chemotaxis protein CheB [bacterium]
MSRAEPSHPSGTVVAVGASAGGLESLGILLAGLPERFPASILVVLHLDPHHESQAVPILQHRTRLRVRTALAGKRPQPGTVYLAPPDHHLQLRAGKMRLTQAARVNYSRPSIDVLFASVAEDRGPAAVGVVLSGTGSDGAAGVALIKARGGTAVAEHASTAAFPFMPAAAGRAGLLDATLPVTQIPAFLLHGLTRRVPVSDLEWQRMLAFLQSRTGARFSSYRSTTLHRRLQQRLAATGCRSMAEYLRILNENEAEVDRLQTAFLIKVSSFFRDQATWAVLARRVDAWATTPGRPRRAWSAGCATGEEAYTLAVLLARRLGTGPGASWTVFGTDLDAGALKVARAARYSRDQVRAIPPSDLVRYFVREGAAWRVRKALRAHVVFGRHDLLHDVPLSAMDVVACRNVLIYFKADGKSRTLARLASAVLPGGFLFLGRSEAPGPLASHDRVGRTSLFMRKGLPSAMPARAARSKKAAPRRRRAPDVSGPLAGSSLIVAVAIDRKGNVELWNPAAQALFGKRQAQVMGKPLVGAVGDETARQLRATMRNPVPQQAVPVECTGVGGRRILEVECLPGAAAGSTVFLGSEVRPEVSMPVAQTYEGLVRAGRRPPPTAAAKLLAQQDLNDELQSRNEELETVNEELQSLNDAMSSMEDEMRGLGEEARRANDFLRLLLDTSSDVLIACNADNRVAFWNDAAIKAYHLSSVQAVGKELFGLLPSLAHAPLKVASRKARASGRTGRVKVLHGGLEYSFDPLSSRSGSRRGYLLRVHQP